jgi:tRNA/tmRNA/rRNA uracil-C5-methylase (TrmA/RlmC/RlmD family)
LEKELLEKILSSPAKELLYVSCHFLSFQRDAEILLQNGWKIQTAEGYLMFPGTDHVEIVAKFKKESDGYTL